MRKLTLHHLFLLITWYSTLSTSSATLFHSTCHKCCLSYSFSQISDQNLKISNPSYPYLKNFENENCVKRCFEENRGCNDELMRERNVGCAVVLYGSEVCGVLDDGDEVIFEGLGSRGGNVGFGYRDKDEEDVQSTGRGDMGRKVGGVESRRSLQEETRFPTGYPTQFPVEMPNGPDGSVTLSPTVLRTAEPTSFPLIFVTSNPTKYPTDKPTKFPTNRPTSFPSQFPTKRPTSFPSGFPTNNPTKFPTTDTPTKFPVAFPTKSPTEFPTKFPSKSPTSFPSLSPTVFPTERPTKFPTKFPSEFVDPANPTNSPTNDAVGVPQKNGVNASFIDKLKDNLSRIIAGGVAFIVASICTCFICCIFRKRRINLSNKKKASEQATSRTQVEFGQDYRSMRKSKKSEAHQNHSKFSNASDDETRKSNFSQVSQGQMNIAPFSDLYSKSNSSLHSNYVNIPRYQDLAASNNNFDSTGSFASFRPPGSSFVTTSTLNSNRRPPAVRGTTNSNDSLYFQQFQDVDEEVNDNDNNEYELEVEMENDNNKSRRNNRVRFDFGQYNEESGEFQNVRPVTGRVVNNRIFRGPPPGM